MSAMSFDWCHDITFFFLMVHHSWSTSLPSPQWGWPCPEGRTWNVPSPSGPRPPWTRRHSHDGWLSHSEGQKRTETKQNKLNDGTNLCCLTDYESSIVSPLPQIPLISTLAIRFLKIPYYAKVTSLVFSNSNLCLRPGQQPFVMSERARHPTNNIWYADDISLVTDNTSSLLFAPPLSAPCF